LKFFTFYHKFRPKIREINEIIQNYGKAAKGGKSQKDGKKAARWSKRRQMPPKYGKRATLVCTAKRLNWGTIRCEAIKVHGG
jgi:hypothetical protein